MKILVTGFEPFGGEKTNPSYEALKLLPDTISGARVLRLQIPTVFGRGAQAVLDALEAEKPDLVLCCGQAGKREGLTPEFVAINYRHARIPDNDGRQPQQEAILTDGPAAYFSRLPVHQIARRCREQGIPAFVSYTAGTYVCNEVMYQLLHAIETRCPKVLGGFLHVPFSTGQAALQETPVPSMSLELMARGIQTALEVTMEGMA